MLEYPRGIRLASLLVVVAVFALIFGLGVHIHRAWSPARRWARESRPGNPQYTRMRAVLNLTYDVPKSELDEAFPVLLAAARDPDPMIRAQATTALGGRRDRFAEVLPILLALMKDPERRVRAAAIFNLESFVNRGSAEASALIPELVAALDDSEPAVRLEACRALYVYRQLQAESPRVVPALVRLIREEEGIYRHQALGYLITIKTIPKELEPTLRALLSVEDSYGCILVREALIVLRIPDPERSSLIKSMLDSPNHNERLTVAYLLIQLGEPEMAIPTLRDLADRGDRSARARAVRMLDMVEP